MDINEDAPVITRDEIVIRHRFGTGGPRHPLRARVARVWVVMGVPSGQPS